MFGLASGLYERYWAPCQLNILVIGEEGVGKSALLERIKVTQFSSKPVDVALPETKADFGHNLADDKKPPVIKEQPPPRRPPLRRRLCPAPAKYAVKLDEEEEEVLLVPPASSNRHSQRSTSGSMEDIPIDEENDSDAPAAHQPQEQVVEYDLKKGAHMLSLDKIRPTIGMNLARVDICGAKCHFWDLGGKMKDIWPKYYPDADAVIICVNAEQQQIKTLEFIQVLRKELPNEETPILVFANVKKSSKPLELGPLVAQYFGSPKTGENVRAAVEWLTSLAMQQQRIIRSLS